jgi:RNA polymerase sigma-70 factor (ECF subfamily)
MNESSLEDLTVAACQGDSDAIDELIEHYLPALRGFVRLRAGAMLRRQESTSDLVQSVCRELLVHQSRFRHPSPAAFRRWLFITAQRKISTRKAYYLAQKRDVMRNMERRLGNSMTNESLVGCYKTLSTPSKRVAAKEDVERIEAAFDELPDEYREVITLAHIVGMTRAEIAEHLGKSEGAVRMTLHRALAAVARVLKKEEES